MATRKIIIYSLASYVIIGLILLQAITWNKLINVFDVFMISATAIAIWLVGLLIGRLIIFFTVDFSIKSNLYAIGQIIAVSLFVGTWLYFSLTEKSNGNSESNKAFAGMTVDDIWNPKNNTIQKAFIKLESNFKDPNEIQLNQWFVIKKDTIIGLDTLKYIDIHFIYLRDKLKFYAVVQSINDNFTVKEIDGNIVDDKFYKTFDSTSNKDMNNIIEAIKKPK